MQDACSHALHISRLLASFMICIYGPGCPSIHGLLPDQPHRLSPAATLFFWGGGGVGTKPDQNTVGLRGHMVGQPDRQMDLQTLNGVAPRIIVAWGSRRPLQTIQRPRGGPWGLLGR